jgi:hypothetical protein
MKTIVVLLLLLSTTSIIAQKDKPKAIKNIVIGGNYTYVPDTEFINGTDNGTFYRENTFAGNVAFDIKKRLRVGLDYKSIKTLGETLGKNQYKMVGLFTQYKIGETKKGFGFGELGLYTGNYCTCGKNMPYQNKNTTYLSWGVGYNVKIVKNLYADFAFTTAQVINVKNEPYGYTQYIIGIDYVFPTTKKEK